LIQKTILEKTVPLHAIFMNWFRKKILVSCIAIMAATSLVAISGQMATILKFFPGVNVSYLLSEELLETAEGEFGKETETTDGLEYYLNRNFKLRLTLHYSDFITSYFHNKEVPPHPYFEKNTPPPEV
jgi:hypothetical protein